MKKIPKICFQYLAVLFCSLMFHVAGHAHDLAAISLLNQKHIVDTTQSLSQQEIALLTKQQNTLKQRKNIDFKILIIPNSYMFSLDQYGHRIFEILQNKKTVHPKNILLVIAMNERKLYSEVSPLLTKEFSQSQVDQIIVETLLPKFQSGNFFEGLNLLQFAIMAKDHAVFDRSSTLLDLKLSHISYVYLCISLLSSGFLFWLSSLIISKFGYSISLAFYSANLIWLIFIHVLMFDFYAFFWISVSHICIPIVFFLYFYKRKKYPVLNILLYSLPLYILALYGFFISYIFKILTNLSLILLCSVSIVLCVYAIYLTLYFYTYRGTEKGSYKVWADNHSSDKKFRSLIPLNLLKR